MLLLLFGGPATPFPPLPLDELVITAPVATHGAPIQRPAESGVWRMVLELADPTAALVGWHDITDFYAGDTHRMGSDDYMGRNRARLVSVQLQIDNNLADTLNVPTDILAPWGQDTTDLFGVNVPLDAGLLMRLALSRVVSGVTVEWEPIWTGRVESWGDASASRGQIRTHVVSVVDTIADMANVPVLIEDTSVVWQDWFTDQLLPGAGWNFGVDIYGEQSVPTGLPFQPNVTAASTLMDAGTDPLGLTWRSLRSGRLVLHPWPWDTTNVERYPNPLLDVYPDGLKFAYSPDFTDIEYIADDDQQPFGISANTAGVLNYFLVTMPGDFGDEVIADDDPVSIEHYGVHPFQATWIISNPQVVYDLKDARAYASKQALPLRTSLDHEGFWSALAIVDHLDPVTVVHQTSDTGLVVTGTGWIRNVVEERTWRGDGLLSWQSTIQVDLAATTNSEALLPVEMLTFVGSESPLLTTTTSAEFSWVNPVQPSITPTHVQYRAIGRSLIWTTVDYPGVGADGATLYWFTPATAYQFQVRLIRMVDGVVTNASPIRKVQFTTAARILPRPIPGDDPTETGVDMPPFDDPCLDDVSIVLQENDGSGWTTVDTFSGSEIEQDADGHWHLVDDIPNSFFNEGSMYRFQGYCGTDLIVTGTPFDPPDDWSDPCTEPPALSTFPYNDSSLLVYVPKICAPDIIREAVSGIEAVKGDALLEIDALLGGDPNQRVLTAVSDPLWSDIAHGIVAYGECPQIVGATGDKTISIRVLSRDDTASVVLGEVAGMTLEAVPVSGGGWRAAVVVYKTDVTITLPSTSILTTDTEYVITATFELATGDINLYINDVPDNSVGSSDAVPTINALPIWRVGAPPGSWVTDFALWDSVFLTPPTGLTTAILATGPKRYYTCEGSLPFTDYGTLGLDTTSSSGSLTVDGEAGEDGRTYLRLDNTGKVVAPYDDDGSFFPNSAQTMLVFLKPDAVTGPQYIVRQSDGTNVRGQLFIDDDPGLGGNRIFYAGANSGGIVYYYSANGGVVASSWNMYTFRQQGVTQEWRKNNVDVSDNAVTSGAALDAVARFALGDSYAGGIAHIATWDRLLSPTELTDIYNAAVADGWTI